MEERSTNSGCPDLGNKGRKRKKKEKRKQTICHAFGHEIRSNRDIAFQTPTHLSSAENLPNDFSKGVGYMILFYPGITIDTWNGFNVPNHHPFLTRDERSTFPRFKKEKKKKNCVFFFQKGSYVSKNMTTLSCAHKPICRG